MLATALHGLTDVRSSSVGQYKSLRWVQSTTAQKVADFVAVDHAVSAVPEVEQIENVLHFCFTTKTQCVLVSVNTITHSEEHSTAIRLVH